MHVCWVHKTTNVLNKLPKSLQAKAKRALQDIWMAETRQDAEAAFDGFIECYGLKYEKAVECLSEDRVPLLAFYDFPAEHWKHLRTDESDREHVRNCAASHDQIKGLPLEQDRTRYDLQARASGGEELAWSHQLRPLPKVICGVKFNNEIEVVRSQAQTAAA